MLMQALDEPHAAHFSPHAEKLLNVLNASRGVWMTRPAIAGALGKKRLNPADTARLEMLAGQGVIEMARVNDSTAMGYHFEYRAK